jgi:hypothetical protein
MLFSVIRLTLRRLTLAAAFFLCAGELTAANGPTLQLDYGSGTATANQVVQFMYFVPLISPEPSTIFTNVGNSQCAQVVSFSSKTNGSTFTAVCEFKFSGTGFLHNIFDHSNNLARHEAQLKAGETLKHQLGAINVEGEGNGRIEIEGRLTNGLPTVNKVAIHFNGHGHVSPITINLQDFAYRDGALKIENEMVARVNSLVFKRTSGTPQMEVNLASIKQKAASNNLWQNFVGDLKGAAANLFLPPLKIEAEGQSAMLDFGLALALEKPKFTFPLATRLKAISSQ